MSIDETFFPGGLLTRDVCTLQLVLLVWGNFLFGFFFPLCLNLSCDKKDALPRALLMGLHPLPWELLGIRACAWR